jgi:hypothetical protein
MAGSQNYMHRIFGREGARALAAFSLLEKASAVGFFLGFEELQLLHVNEGIKNRADYVNLWLKNCANRGGAWIFRP